MQTRQPTTRTVPRPQSAKQWDEMIDSVATGDEIIVESRSGAKAAVISYEEFLEVQEQRKRQRLEEALSRLEEMEKKQARRNADLSEEEIERIALEAGREIRESLNKKYRAGLIGFPESDPE